MTPAQKKTLKDGEQKQSVMAVHLDAVPNASFYFAGNFAQLNVKKRKTKENKGKRREKGIKSSEKCVVKIWLTIAIRPIAVQLTTLSNSINYKTCFSANSY